MPMSPQSPSSSATRVAPPPPDVTTSPARPNAPPDETGIVFSQSGASSSGSPLPSVAASDGSGGFWHNPGAVAGVFIPLAFALGGLVFFIGKYLNNRKQNARTTPYQAVGNGSGADMEQGPYLPTAAPLSPFYYDPYNDHPTQQIAPNTSEPWQQYRDDPQPLQRSDTVFSNPSVYSQDGATLTSPTDSVPGHGGMQGVGAHGGGGGGQGVSIDGLMNSGPGAPSQGTAPNMGGSMPTAPNATVGGFNAPAPVPNPVHGVSPYVPVFAPPLGYLSTHLEESEPESDDEEFAGSSPALPIRNRRRFDENSCIDEPARARLLQRDQGAES
ncbi:hypothetical protein AURDEDRAFT_109708 [Auricularia subglabra TFB-10046 SS5]|nr:hypothetical protein AURDEDRAFT_109708 [Auricularia subglabra TFB-10046 SS5]